MTTASPRVLRDEKNRGKKQQTDPRGEEKNEKQHKLRMNMQNLYNYFGLKHKRFSNRIHVGIVKL